MRKSVIAFLGVAVLLVGISTLLAQGRAPVGLPGLPPPPPGFGESPGRYTIVKVTDTAIILLDTANGDLYKATFEDAKPYKERTKPNAGGVPIPKDFPPIPKDGPPSRDK